MEVTSPLSAGPIAPSGRDRRLPLPEQWRRACVAQDDLRIMGMPRVNMLFIGADDVVWRVLGTQLPLAAPIATWEPGQPFELPAVACARTMVIREVGHLSPTDQVRMLGWLDRAVGRTQVVSTSGASLLPLLESGAFLNALYYRLNTVCVDLNG